MSRAWIAAVLVLAAALRLYPIWFGLPYLRARPDEDAAVGMTLAVLRGDPNPHFFHWPSLTFYLFAALFTAASWTRRAIGLDPALDPAQLLLTARAFVALAGTATVYVLYRLGRRVAGERTAVVAALFLAVALLHVRDSHFAMTDVIMTLLATLSLGLLLAAMPADRAAAPAPPGWFAAAGFTAGLAASTKYSAAALAAAMAAAQLLLWSRDRADAWRLRSWRPSLAYGAALAAGFVVGTPFAILDVPTFWRDLRFTMDHLSGGHGVDLGRGWRYHLTTSLPYGVGIPVYLAALAGMVSFARRHPRPAVVLGAFAAAFYASLAGGQTVFFRYVLPLVPLLCLSAAVFVRDAAPWLAARTGMRPAVAAGVLLAATAGPSLVHAVWFDALLGKTDTRVLAARWLAARLQPEHSLHDAGGTYSQLDLSRLRFHQWYFDPAARSFNHPEGRLPDWLVFHESPLRVYTGAAPELRQLARDRYQLVERIQARHGRASAAVYDQQDAFFLPFSGFHTVLRPGPTIFIYRRVDP